MADVHFHQFLVLSAISHSPLKILQVSKFKGLQKKWASHVAPGAPLPTAMSFWSVKVVHSNTSDKHDSSLTLSVALNKSCHWFEMY